MAQLNLYKYVNPGGVRDKNLEQITINAQKFMIRKGGGASQSQMTDRTNGYNAYGRKTLLGINRLGSSLNSAIITVDQISNNLKSFTKDISKSDLKRKKFEDNQYNTQKKLLKLKQDKDKRDDNARRREVDKSSEASSEKGLGGKFLSPVKKVAKKIGGGLLDFLGNLFGLFLRTALITGVLKFIADPQNVEKVGKFFVVVRNILKFFAKVIEFGVYQAVEGLVKIIDGGIFTKLVGVFQFLGGILVLFAAQRWLNPFKIGRTISDLKVVFKVLSFLPKALMGAARAAVAISQAAAGKWGWKKVLIGGGIAVGAGLAINEMTKSDNTGNKDLGDQQQEQQDQTQQSDQVQPPGPAGQQTSPANTLVQGTDQTKPKPGFAVGGISKGPDAGYPVTLHGTEAIIPLDNRYTRSGGDPLANVMPGLSKSIGSHLGSNLPSSGAGGGSSNILSGIGGLSKTSQSISDGMKLPFKAVGTSLLANLGNVVSSLGPLGNLVRPFVQQIATPIAQSFGVPATIVSLVTSKEKIEGSAIKEKGKGKDDLREKIGEGSVTIKTPDSNAKWTPGSNKSIRGMLADVVSGLLFMSGKIDKKKGANQVQQTTQEQTTQSNPTSPDLGSKVTQTASGSAGSGRMSQVAGTKEGIGITDKDRNRQTGQLEQNYLNFKYQGQDYKVLINPNNGEYKLFKERAGLLWTDKEIMLGGPKGPKKGGLNEKLLQLTHNHVQAFFTENAPEKGLALKYIDQTMIDNYKKSKDKKPPEKKAGGGWISGPHSGYPVSLDGGRSVAFEGHGTEWVGFKKAAGGMASSAFVIPYDTPKTKSHPGLTQKRFAEAKAGGYVLPYAKGGTVSTDTNWQGDTGPGSRWSLISNQKSKDALKKKRLKAKFADGGKIAEAAKSMVGTYFGPNGCAKSTRAMLGKAGVAPSPLVTKQVLDKGTPGAEPTGTLKANSFGPDQGAVVKSAGAVQAGDIVMWDTGGGVIGHVGVAIGNGQVVHNSSSAGHKLAKMGVTGMKFHSAIRLGATGTVSSTSDNKDGKSGSESGSGDSSGNWMKALTDAFTGKTAADLLGVPATSSTEVKPATTPSTGSQVLKQSSDLKDKKATESSKPEVSAINNPQKPNIQSSGGGGVVSISSGVNTKQNNTDFLIPMGSPLHNYVSPESLNKIK